MGNGTKIEIGTVAALERLLGGDTELEIQLRKAVAQEFCVQHLRSLVTEMCAGGMITDFKADVGKQIELEVKQILKDFWTVEKRLSPHYAESLRQAVRNEYKAILETERAWFREMMEQETASRRETMDARARSLIRESEKLVSVDLEINKVAKESAAKLMDNKFHAAVEKRVAEILREAARNTLPETCGRAIDVSDEGSNPS